MFHTILVPLDGSQRSEAILDQVEDLALCCRARVILMRVVDPPIWLGTPQDAATVERIDEIMEQVEEECRLYLEGLCRAFETKGIRTETRVMHGAVVEAITHLASVEKADLIAIASHGRSGLGNVVYGSVVAGVLHKSGSPLLVLRSPFGEPAASSEPETHQAA